jgi:hypothetical protein
MVGQSFSLPRADETVCPTLISNELFPTVGDRDWKDYTLNTWWSAQSKRMLS